MLLELRPRRRQVLADHDSDDDDLQPVNHKPIHNVFDKFRSGPGDRAIQPSRDKENLMMRQGWRTTSKPVAKPAAIRSKRAVASKPRYVEQGEESEEESEANVSGTDEEDASSVAEESASEPGSDDSEPGSQDSDASSGDDSSHDSESASDAEGIPRIRQQRMQSKPWAAAGSTKARSVRSQPTVAEQTEKILASRRGEGGAEGYLVKLQETSYRAPQWVARASLEDCKPGLLRGFLKRQEAGELNAYGDLVDGVHPDWIVVDRVIAHKPGTLQQYLVKWRGLGYSEATWEAAQDLTVEADQAAVQRYHALRCPEQDRGWTTAKPSKLKANTVPEFCNGRELRSYQEESLAWMAANWVARRNCILGDEMGLGKTAQSISILAFQQQFGGVAGPFLILVPLTTIGHWQREIQTWTTMDVVVYAGSAADRAAIQQYDLWKAGSGQRRIRPNIVLTSFDTLLRDRSLLLDVDWATVIVDEAHRMKSTGSSTRAVLASLTRRWLLLLTGTPVQNNMRELHGILSLLDPEFFGTEQEFFVQYGDERTGMNAAQVQKLKAALKPILLRRMKEDVETLPEKEEVIIWVELTAQQRTYYRALYEKQIGTLMAGTAPKNLPNLKNLAMELRKVCCHPFLCNGLEDDLTCREAEAGGKLDSHALTVAASGKMLLLAKLLPKLRREGRKVLIFSQFKIMLDVLEDFLDAGGHPHERIDGSTPSRDRQAAIDRFSSPGSDGFVFLLSTRAGGQGITLTAADTCIIYDSDWNPQNDLQAMARCHRIGQDKEVTIYRLVTRDTYESKVFEISSRKAGLDEAILGGMAATENPESDSRKISQLLQHGAHGLQDMSSAAQQTNEFLSEDIDQILAGRTEKRQIGSRAGNSFSVASFNAGGGQDGSDHGAEYWLNLMPAAVAALKETAAAPEVLAPRKRRVVDYRDKVRTKAQQAKEVQEDKTYVVEDADMAGYSSSGGEDAEDGEAGASRRRSGSSAAKGEKKQRRPRDPTANNSLGDRSLPKQWIQGHVIAFESQLFSLGEGRLEQVLRGLPPAIAPVFDLEDAATLATFLAALARRIASLDLPEALQLSKDSWSKYCIPPVCCPPVLELLAGKAPSWDLNQHGNPEAVPQDVRKAAVLWESQKRLEEAGPYWAEVVMPGVEPEVPKGLVRLLGSAKFQARWLHMGPMYAASLDQWTAIERTTHQRSSQFVDEAAARPYGRLARWFDGRSLRTALAIARDVGFPTFRSTIPAQHTREFIMTDPRMEAIVMEKDEIHPTNAGSNALTKRRSDKHPQTLVLCKQLMDRTAGQLASYLQVALRNLAKASKDDSELTLLPLDEYGWTPIEKNGWDLDHREGSEDINRSEPKKNRATEAVPDADQEEAAAAPEAVGSAMPDQNLTAGCAGDPISKVVPTMESRETPRPSAKRTSKQLSMSAFVAKRVKPTVVDLLDNGMKDSAVVVIE